MADDEGGDRSELTRDGTVVGTPDYMSPEQAKNSSSVDARADLYSLGCTLYYLLRGTVPFPEGTSIDKLIRHQLDPVPDVRHGRSDIPHHVGEIVARLMRKKADERYRTAAEVAALLANHTPDAAAFDLSPPSAGSAPAPGSPAFVPVDLAPPPALESLALSVSPPMARSTTRTAAVGRTPKATATPPVPQAAARPAVAKAIPRPGVEPPSGESHPTPAPAKRPRPSGPPSGGVRPRKGKPAKPEKRFPTLTVVVVGLFAVLLLGIGAVALVRLGGHTPPASTTPATEPRKTPPTVAEPPPRNNYRDIDSLLPDGTEAVLLYHPKPYWDKLAADGKFAGRLARMVEHLTLRFHFDPRRFERGVVAFQADPTHAVASGEGAWLSPEWLRLLEKPRRIQVEASDARGLQVVRFHDLAGKELPTTRGAILKGSAYLLGDDRAALESLLTRLRSSEENAAVDPLLLPAVREAAKGTPLLLFAAAGGWHFPTKLADTLGVHGVDLLTVSGRLDRDFHLDATLVGKDKSQLKEFLGVALPKMLAARNEKLKPLADAIRAASDEATVELDPRGFRVQAKVVWKWDDVAAAAEAVIPPVVVEK